MNRSKECIRFMAIDRQARQFQNTIYGGQLSKGAKIKIINLIKIMELEE